MPRKTYRKQITSGDLSLQFNEVNVKIIEKFLKEKNSRSSSLTVKNYKSDLDIFQTWNLQNNNNKGFYEIKKLEFSEFFIYAIEELQWGSARFSRMKSVLSSLSNFIEKYYDEEYPSFRNVILKAVESMPKNERREKTVLSDKQIQDLFLYLENEPQIACWLALATSSGSRFSELLRFTTDIIDINHTAFQDIFIETLQPIRTKGRGRDGKMLVKYIIKDIFIPHYEKWLIERSNVLNKYDKNHNYVFIKNNGDPLGESGARVWVNKIEKFLNTSFYPHCLRHFFCTYLASKGLPYELIKEITGWSSVQMVEVYNDVTAKDKKWQELENFKN
jgi:site-specific recombinase XerD